MIGLRRRLGLRSRTAIFVTLAIAILIGGGVGSWSAFRATGSNTGNSVGSGTVALTDNDSDGPVVALPSAAAGANDTGCIKVTYNGTLASSVRLYGATSGTGVDPHVSLTVTRGTYSPSEPSFSSCTNFQPDSTTYITGKDPGVVYSGTLQNFPDSYATGIDDDPAGVPEAWISGESHVYKIEMAVADDNSAAGKNASQTFTWEARNEPAYASQVLSTPGLVSYWRLGESAGTTALDSQGTNDGTYNDVSGGLGQPGALVGDTDTAVRFEGTPDHVDVPDSSSLNPTGSVTTEAWFKPTTTKDHGIVVKTGPNAGWERGYALYTNMGKFNFLIGDGTDFEDSGHPPTDYTLDTWYHVVGVYNSGDQKLYLYVNGSLVADSGAATQGPPAAPSEPLSIGRKYGMTSQSAEGVIDEVAIYNTALSASQVAAHYNAGIGN